MVGLLVSIVIVGILIAIFLNGGFGVQAGNPRPDNVGQTVVGRSAARAKDEVCRNNLSQLRMAIQMQRDTDNPPATLADVPGMGVQFKKCAIQPYEPYVYDAASGIVRCPHPGHERF